MSEKKPALVLRFLAIVLAVALGGTYIGWRQTKANQAAQHSAKAAETLQSATLMAGSKSPDTDYLDPKNPPDLERALMSSSKSMIMTKFVEIDESSVDELGFDWILEPPFPEDPAEEESP